MGYDTGQSPRLDLPLGGAQDVRSEISPGLLGGISHPSGIPGRPEVRETYL